MANKFLALRNIAFPLASKIKMKGSSPECGTFNQWLPEAKLEGGKSYEDPFFQLFVNNELSLAPLGTSPSMMNTLTA